MRRSIATTLVLAALPWASPAAAGDCPGAVQADEFACFANAGASALVLRVEWPDGRWAVHAHPAAARLRLHIGSDEAIACWRPAAEAARLVGEPCGDKARRVLKGCDGSS